MQRGSACVQDRRERLERARLAGPRRSFARAVGAGAVSDAGEAFVALEGNPTGAALGLGARENAIAWRVKQERIVLARLRHRLRPQHLDALARGICIEARTTARHRGREVAGAELGRGARDGLRHAEVRRRAPLA
jgi:hypothetical protein